ncbi:hypothetical protein EDB89DRAFT_1848868, partial [Lactarius sanguifluus]
VYDALLASTNGELPVLRISRPDIEKWLKERMITSAFLERIVNIISKAGQSYPSSASPLHLLTCLALRAETRLTTTSSRTSANTPLSYSTVFDIGPFFKLDAVFATQAYPLFEPLRIFLSDGLDDLRI